jgi:asparagine synthase (glutamine-hydrolysing)
MCRFLGNIAFESNILSQEDFITLTFLSKKGGPDHTDYFFNDFVQLGFNRLAILDTSYRGKQPIHSPSGRFVIMLNGEIYNFSELSRKYGLMGLRSSSDAEVIAHLLDVLPFDTVIAQLNGMFAISVWDQIDRRLFLVRDFAGIKPIFYGITSSGFVFGSQFNQILLHPWFQNWSFSARGLREYLQFGFMDAPNTVAEDVFQLRPGTWMVYSAESNSVEMHEYQTYFKNDLPVRIETDISTVHECGNILNEAVKRQLTSDVPLGVFLSGGVDSSLIAAIASRLHPDIQSLTIGFEELDFDESNVAAEYARFLGIKNECIMFSDTELLKLFDEHNAVQNEPLADCSTLPTYLISKVASSRFKVMLSGDGGDELFWGYPRFKTFAKSAPFFDIKSRFLRRVIMRFMKQSGNDITSFLGQSTIGDANLAFHSSINSKLLDKLLSGSHLSDSLKNDYRFQSVGYQDVLLHLRFNEYYHHLQRVLAKVDRMSMSNGLEVRVPFLDRQLLEFTSTILPACKNDELKYILKNLLYQFIPKNNVSVFKKGFKPPLDAWVSTVLNESVRSTLRNGIDLINGNVDLELQKVFDYAFDYLDGKHSNLEGFWSVFAFSNWFFQQKQLEQKLKIGHY